MSPRDAVALLRLAHETGHGDAARWEATLSEVLWLARRHLGEGWESFAADLRASQGLQALWGAPWARSGRPSGPAGRAIAGLT